MTDRLLRTAQRAAAQGDPEAEARHLAARMRAGDLPRAPCRRCGGAGYLDWSDGHRGDCYVCEGTGRTPARRTVALLAYCGNGAARAVLGRCPACDPPQIMVHDRGDEAGYAISCPACKRVRPWPRRWPVFPSWLEGLRSWGRTVTIRAAVAAAKATLPAREAGEGMVFLGMEDGCFLYEREDGEPPRFKIENKRFIGMDALGEIDASTARKLNSLITPRRAILIAEDWLEDPSPENQQRCGLIGTTQDPARLVSFYIGSDGDWTPSEPNGEWCHVILEAARDVGDEAVRTAICEALVKWGTGPAS